MTASRPTSLNSRPKLNQLIASAEGGYQAEARRRERAERGKDAAQARNRQLEAVFRELTELVESAALVDGLEVVVSVVELGKILEGAK